MHVRPTVLAVMAVGAVAACGAPPRVGVAAGAGGGGGQGTSSATGAGGAPADPWPTKLAGYWVQQSIGNCINGEEWYTFSPPAGFVHTVVDRNFCGPHSVRVDPGSASAAAQIVSLAWTSPTSNEQRSFSAAVLDPYPSPPPPPDPSYVAGARALNTMAYRRAGAPLVWRRETTSKSDWSTPAPGSSSTSLKIDVTLDAAPAPSTSPVACAMTLAFEASASPASGPLLSSGTESWSLPCHYANKGPWILVTADGFEQSDVDSSWTDFLTAKGIDAKYAPAVVSLFDEGFRPILYLAPSQPDEMFHDIGFAWFYEMKNPPPATVQ
jgi:hypothetical protein